MAEIPTSYLTVEEIEAAGKALDVAYPQICSQFTLPMKTVEGRTVTGLRIGIKAASHRPHLLLLGGVHAREWVPPDALVYLIADVLEAYSRGLGIRYGSTYFNKQTIKRIIEGVGIVAVFCVNPDGRAYSQSNFPLWRGNRRVVQKEGKSSFGVDLNRNYDFLWNFDKFFDPNVAPATDDPYAERQDFHGPGACSEPETQNVVSLYNRFPISVLVDVHSYGPVLLRNWGDDENQSTEPLMNFRNTAFDGKRGLIGDGTYKEYIPNQDEDAAIYLLNKAATAVAGVRGSKWEAAPAWTLYPTSGAGDDYAYSRHFCYPTKLRRVLSFTFECGSAFQPDFPEAAEVMKEVAAAILGISSAVLKRKKVSVVSCVSNIFMALCHKA